MNIKLINTLFIVLFSALSFGQEICNNGIDDDNDGLIDLNDNTECNCTLNSSNPTSLIPNPSFENNNCVPNTFSQLNCADNWIQATDATSDYFINPSYNPVGMNAANGNAYVGCIYSDPFYLEYVGSCLLSPMVAGTSYTLQLSASAQYVDGILTPLGTVPASSELVLYANANCANLPVSTFSCPDGLSGWYAVQTLTFTPVLNQWQTLTFQFTPTANINAVMLGASCNFSDPNSTFDSYHYVLIDNLTMNTSSSFGGASQQGSFCNNDLTLSIANNPGSTYQWYYEGLAILGATGTSLFLDNSIYEPGEYTVVETNNGDCSASVLDVVDQNAIVPTGQANSVCLGETTEFSATFTNPGNGITLSSFEWDLGDGTTETTANFDHVYATAGNFQTTLHTVASNGCESTSNLTVNVSNAPTASFVYTPTDLDILDQQVLVINSSTNATSYQWIFDGASIGNSTNLTIPLNLPEGFYPLTLIASSGQGCVDTVTQVIEIKDLLLVFVPNTFTPDGDEYNNTFEVVISEIVDPQNFELVIFNRWGEVIFESKDPAGKWDGTYHGKLVPTGTYTWRLKAGVKGNDFKFERNGHISILK